MTCQNKTGNPIIKTWGCYFSVDLAIGERARGRSISLPEELSILGTARSTRLPNGLWIVGSECYINDHDELIGLTGAHVETLGSYDVGSEKEVPDDTWNFVVLTFELGARRHRVLGADLHNVDWDPWEGGAETTKLGTIVSRRFYRVVA